MGSAVAKTHRLSDRNAIKHPTETMDSVVDLVREWIDALSDQDALVNNWQAAEHQLSIKARRLKISLGAAARGSFPEAKSMRLLMRRIKSADRELARRATKIISMRSTSSCDALAKLDMALRMKHSSIDDDQAWELISSAVAQLRELLRQRSV
jgi:hypothetical protein